MSRSVSLHRTTPSLSDVFKNSSGSAMFFLGEQSTPSDINHVTVCSSGFIAPQNDHCLSTHSYKKTGGLFRINMQLTSALLLQVKKKKKRGGGGRTTLFLHAKLMITPTGKQAPQQCTGVIIFPCSDTCWHGALVSNIRLQMKREQGLGNINYHCWERQAYVINEPDSQSISSANSFAQ